MKPRVANRQESLLGFLNQFSVVEPKDSDDWNNVLSDPFLTSNALFWYPASGLHLSPLVNKYLPILQHEKIGLYIYTDYGVREDRFRLLYEQMGKGKIKIDSRFHQAPAPWDQMARCLEVTQMIQLKPTDAGLQEILSRRGNEELSRPAGVIGQRPKDVTGRVLDDPFWYIAMADAESQYRMLFTPVDHFWLLNGALIPHGVNIDYLCAHKDGCAKGGAWVCCNNIDDIFFRTVMSSPCRPKYWITDHWKNGMPPGFRALGGVEWGGHGGLTKIYRIESVRFLIGKPALPSLVR